MDIIKFREIEDKIIIYTNSRLCETGEELLDSKLFIRVLNRFIDELRLRQSRYLDIFNGDISDEKIQVLHLALKKLLTLDKNSVSEVLPESLVLFRDTQLLNDFIENMYNYWRSFERYVIYESVGGQGDKKPHRTFNLKMEKFADLVIAVYRDIRENITGNHPIVYRQLHAGAGIAVIGLSLEIPYPSGSYDKLCGIRIIRQMLLNPPVILEPKSNKRKGRFRKINENPLDLIELNISEWICYPALVGELLIHIYFHESFYELGFSLCNLFELADNAALLKKPDAIYLYGIPGDKLDRFDEVPAVFFDDEENGIMIGACPDRDMFGYFGYLKKMTLTLHNSIMIKRGRLPFHGALVRVLLKKGGESTILIMGDSGAGKSETLEAFRNLGKDYLRDMIIIADDMGSLELSENGDVIAYGTETGAFLRIDDLTPGYAFGQIDRSILMGAAEVNARIILPVTTYDTVVKGHRIEMVLYANNYEQVDEDHPIIERFKSVENAFNLFREGTVMSKGTTASTGIVHSYFANIFGPPQYKKEHDALAIKFFNAFFSGEVFVGQMRTRLGISGYEMTGPEAAAKELLNQIMAD